MKTAEKEVEVKLIKKCLDLGYPDPGHDEYFLVRSAPRSNKYLQSIFGNKEIVLLCYGEDKPSNEELKKDILLY